VTVARQKQPGRYGVKTVEAVSGKPKTLSVGGHAFRVDSKEVTRRKNTLPTSKTSGIERPTFVRDLLRANEAATEKLNDLELAQILIDEFGESQQTVRIVLAAGGEVGTTLDKWAKWLRVQRSVYNRKQLRNEDEATNTWSFQYVEQSAIIPYTQTRRFPNEDEKLKWLTKNWKEDPRLVKPQ